MYKRLLLGSFVIGLALTASWPARSQTEMQQAPSQQTQPGQQAPSQQTQPGQQAPDANVSSQDLQKFVSAFKQIQTIQQDYQGRMAQAVEQRGLSQERFFEIQQSQGNPSAQPGPQVTDEERQNYQQANTQVSQLKEEAVSKMEQAVQSEGLDVQRFNEIIAAIQQDPSLQKQVQQMLQK
jgi:hypothetical protein